MRRLILAGLLAVAGCATGVASDLGVDVVKIGLIADGTRLKLDSAPQMPTSDAVYPNPRHHEWMSIYVTSDARVVVSCRTGSSRVACADSPITVKVEGGANPTVRVFDLFQHPLAQIPYTGGRCNTSPGGPSATGTPGSLPEGTSAGAGAPGLPEGSSSGPPAGSSGTPAGSGSTGTPASNLPGTTLPIEGGSTLPSTGNSAPVSSTGLSLEGADDPNVVVQVEDPGDVPAGSDGEDGKDDDARPTLGRHCSPPSTQPTPAGAPGGECGLTVKARFCGLVNDGLRSRKMAFQYDCAHLDMNLKFPTPQLDGEVHCKREITDPASRQVTTEFSTCSNQARDWGTAALAEIRNTGLCGGSPLVLDLDGDGVQLTSSATNGVAFDLLAQGQRVHSGWVGAREGLLAIDQNANGQIDDGTELFGQATFGASWADGFAALASLDANHDGVLDERDPAFARLQVWIDADGDGHSDTTELRSLPAVGVRELHLGAQQLERKSAADGQGNWIPLLGHFTRVDGSRGQLVDAWFGLGQ